MCCLPKRQKAPALSSQQRRRHNPNKTVVRRVRILVHPTSASSQLIDTSDKGQFTKRLREDKAQTFVFLQRSNRPISKQLTYWYRKLAFASTTQLSTSQPIETSSAGQISTTPSELQNHQGRLKEAAQGQTELFSQPKTTEIGQIFKGRMFCRYTMWSQSLVIQSPTRG